MVRTKPVRINLSTDEVIVLWDWLDRMITAERFEFEDQAEARAVWNLEATLEPLVQEMGRSDYLAALKAARERLRDVEEEE